VSQHGSGRQSSARLGTARATSTPAVEARGAADEQPDLSERFFGSASSTTCSTRHSARPNGAPGSGCRSKSSVRSSGSWPPSRRGRDHRGPSDIRYARRGRAAVRRLGDRPNRPGAQTREEEFARSGGSRASSCTRRRGRSSSSPSGVLALSRIGSGAPPRPSNPRSGRCWFAIPASARRAHTASDLDASQRRIGYPARLQYPTTREKFANTEDRSRRGGRAKASIDAGISPS